MIKSFKDKDTEEVFKQERSRKLPSLLQRSARRKLRVLNRAISLADLNAPPGNRLEPLKGDRKGQHSIRVNDQWRICFVRRDGDAYDVEITDHH